MSTSTPDHDKPPKYHRSPAKHPKHHSLNNHRSPPVSAFRHINYTIAKKAIPAADIPSGPKPKHSSPPKPTANSRASAKKATAPPPGTEPTKPPPSSPPPPYTNPHLPAHPAPPTYALDRLKVARLHSAWAIDTVVQAAQAQAASVRAEARTLAREKAAVQARLEAQERWWATGGGAGAVARLDAMLLATWEMGFRMHLEQCGMLDEGGLEWMRMWGQKMKENDSMVGEGGEAELDDAEKDAWVNMMRFRELAEG
jgi:type IV secretory pathway VirB10-like protein